MTYRSALAGVAALLLPLLANAAERLIIDHVTVIEGAGRAPQPGAMRSRRSRATFTPE